MGCTVYSLVMDGNRPRIAGLVHGANLLARMKLPEAEVPEAREDHGPNTPPSPSSPLLQPLGDARPRRRAGPGGGAGSGMGD